MAIRLGPVCSVFLAVVLPGAVAAVELTPHQAVYRMSLESSTRGSDVVAADGTMLYRFARECDGWTVENRTLLTLADTNDKEMQSLWTFASWESFDGQRFRFHTRYLQDGATIERLEGDAALDSAGAGGRVRFTQPEAREMPLPEGTLFPTEHTRTVIAAAEGGRKILAKVLFDGASLDNPYRVNAVFGPLSASAAERLAAAAGLPPGPAWWSRMAYFPYRSRAEQPEFEIGAHYRADGIADRIVQVYENFSLIVRLKELEVLPPPDC